MAQCKNCGRKALFLSVTKNGLCKTCDAVVVMDVQQRVRIIQDSINLIEKSKITKTKVSRCDTLLEHAGALAEYERKGIPTLQPLPSQFITEYTAQRDNIICDGVTAEVDKALAKAELATSSRTSVGEANKALLKIRDAKEELEDPSRLDTLEARVKTFSHETQLNTFIEAARKAEFKGQKKKAIDQYQEALFFLKNDDIDDELQGREISKLEKKIAELQNSPE